MFVDRSYFKKVIVLRKLDILLIPILLDEEYRTSKISAGRSN
jgi:hypothetical protein